MNYHAESKYWLAHSPRGSLALGWVGGRGTIHGVVGVVLLAWSPVIAALTLQFVTNTFQEDHDPTIGKSINKAATCVGCVCGNYGNWLPCIHHLVPSPSLTQRMHIRNRL